MSSGLEFTGNAAALLKQPGNIELESNLEEGATYRLTVDFSECTISGNAIEGKEKVSFEKL